MSKHKLVQQWQQFMQIDASSGIILVLAAFLALIMANSFFSASYNAFLEFPVSFIMSLFIGTLAFEEQGLAYQTQVKVGVLVGSLVSVVAGAYLLRKSSKKLAINNGNNKGNNNEKIKA